jgi:hypothetical protein
MNCFSMAQQPLMGQGPLIIEASRSHSDTPHTRWDSSGRVISPKQGPLPDNTQHSKGTTIHTPGGIRTHNPSKRGAAIPCLRPRGHGDRLYDYNFEITHLKCGMSKGYVSPPVLELYTKISGNQILLHSCP